MMWLIGGLILFCMANHLIHKDINKDDRFYYLRKMLGVGREQCLFTECVHMASRAGVRN